MTEQESKMKRPRGSGRIFLRGKTYWASFYALGREVRESCETDDPAKAEKRLRACLKRVHVHEAHPEEKLLNSRDRRKTVADLMDALAVNFELRGKASPQNLSRIARVKKDFGSHRALALTPEAIANYIRDRLAQGDAKASVNRITQVLAQGFKLADLPAPKMLRLDERDNVRRGFFTESEIRAVMTNLDADLADFVAFAWCTGMRKGEVASLRWADLEDDVITLRSENAKNGHSRTVPLAGELLEIVERRRVQQVLNKLDRNPSPLIFSRDGRPIREFRKSWRTATRLANCPGRLFHDLRRSAVRDLIRCGVPQAVAQTLSGHRSSSVFARYNIVTETEKHAALQRVQEYRQKGVTVTPQVASVN
jgi:integrase